MGLKLSKKMLSTNVFQVYSKFILLQNLEIIFSNKALTTKMALNKSVKDFQTSLSSWH